MPLNRGIIALTLLFVPLTVVIISCKGQQSNRDGENILFQPTDVVGLGLFEANETGLIAGFPYRKTPRSYNRKLRLVPPLTAFIHLEGGEQYTLNR
ncbi:MAG: hypothetical protein ACP5D1_02875 [Bacteroidales bacterium]